MSQNEKSPQEKRSDAYFSIMFGVLVLVPSLCVAFSGGPGWIVLLGFFLSISSIIGGIFVLKELNEHK